jgi:gamma-aminobutyric acid type B receptor
VLSFFSVHSKSLSTLHRQRLNEELEKEGYDISHNRYPEGYQEAPLAYDAVWSVALAFNKTMERLKVKNRSLKDFTYTDKDIADEIYAAMNSTQFLGVSVSEINENNV